MIYNVILSPSRLSRFIGYILLLHPLHNMSLNYRSIIFLTDELIDCGRVLNNAIVHKISKSTPRAILNESFLNEQ